MGRRAKVVSGSLSDCRIVPDSEKIESILGAFCEGIVPPESLDLDEWSDEYRRLPRETSSEYGRWKTSRFPFLKKIMKALSPRSRAREITVMKGAQLGFTELCINWMLFTADHNPGPMLYCQKTIDAAVDFSNQKLLPNIMACEKVAESLGAKKPKHLTDEILTKNFPGGFLSMGGVNSGAFLRSKSIRDAMADEEDSYDKTVDGEGSTIGTIRKRLANFPFSKFFRLSTPKIDELSTIKPAFYDGSQEFYYLPCPECNPEAMIGGPRFVLRWSDDSKVVNTVHAANIYFTKNDLDESGIPREIYTACPHCGAVIHEHHKTWMLEHGEWMSEKGSPGRPYIVGDVEYPSFHISSLYSPLGFFSWRDAVKEYCDYLKDKDPALLQTFINQTCGETYSAAGQDISSQWLYSRREEYLADVPMGGLVLTCGVDVQQDRLEAEIVAWGRGMESWSVDFRVLWGDPSITELVDPHTKQLTPWGQLDELLRRDWSHESGQRLVIECMVIDTGFLAEPVHVFCRNREGQRVFPIKGQDGWGKGYIERPKRRHEKYHTWDFKGWVDELKKLTYSHLEIDQPGPGYWHFPKKEPYTPAYFKGLTSETLGIKRVNGHNRLGWTCPSGVRNEPLDCRNYAMAALKIYSPNMDYRSDQMMQALESGSGGMIGAEGSARVSQPPVPVASPHQPRRVVRRVASRGL
jgi:phage terminase large subunit GpA-like protein